MIEATPSPYRRLWIADLLWILLLLIVATVPFLNPALDIKLMSGLYEADLNQHPWPLKFNSFFRALYTFGTLPALVTALTGLGIFAASYYRPTLARWRRHAAFLFLALVIGPGLLVNTVFKEHWGRPRPKMVSEFRGHLNYQCFYETGTQSQGKSFPCGHSSMGYYFVVLYFLTRRRKKLIRLSLLAGAMLYGTLMGITRMTAGAHFASDVLWSAVYPCLAAWALYYFVFKIPFHEDQPRAPAAPVGRPPKWLLWLAPPLAVATITAVLLATPALLKIQISEAIPTNGLTRVEMVVAEPGHPHTDFCFIDQKTNTAISGRIIITGEVQGFGMPWNRIHHSAVWSQTNGVNVLRFTCITKGDFSELDGQLTVEAPAGTQIIRIAP